MKLLIKKILICTIFTTMQALFAMDDIPTITVEPATPTPLAVPSQHSDKIIDIWVDPTNGTIMSIYYQEVRATLDALKSLRATNSLALAHLASACRRDDKRVMQKFITPLNNAGFRVDDYGYIIDPKICFIVSYAVEFKISASNNLCVKKILNEDELYALFATRGMLRSYGF